MRENNLQVLNAVRAADTETAATTHRIENIRTLLETYRDAVEALQSGNGGKNTDEFKLRWHELYQSNFYWEGSYRELEHVLARLLNAAPAHYRQISLRFLQSRRVIRTLRKDGFGKWQGVDRATSRVVWAVPRTEGVWANRYDAIVETWDAAVDPALVDEALRLMEAVWRGEPRIPEITEKAPVAKAA